MIYLDTVIRNGLIWGKDLVYFISCFQAKSSSLLILEISYRLLSLAFYRHTYLGRNIKRASTAAYLKEITMLKEDKIVVQRAVT